MRADYVIIGAGSAGCVLANRLSEDPGTKVILIEAGGRDWSPYIHVPAGFMKMLDHPTLTWGYHAEPDPGTAGRAYSTSGSSGRKTLGVSISEDQCGACNTFSEAT